MRTWRTPAAAALSHSRRGWVLVPLRPGTNRPARKWKNLTSTPPGAIAAWWPGSLFNPGILPGPSNLVIFDLDSLTAHGCTLPPEWADRGVTCGADVLAILAERAGQAVPATYTVLSLSGTHLYFTAPAGPEIRNSAGRVGPLVDVRGCGGLVVGAGSVRGGRTYELADDRDPVALPGWLADLAVRPVTRDVYVTCDDRGHENGDVRSDAGGYAAAALRSEVAALLGTGRGSRNDQLNRSAFSLGTLVAAGDLTKAEVTAALLAAAEAIGLADDDGRAQCKHTIASGLAAGMAKPRNRRAA